MYTMNGYLHSQYNTYTYINITCLTKINSYNCKCHLSEVAISLKYWAKLLQNVQTAIKVTREAQQLPQTGSHCCRLTLVVSSLVI